MADTKISSMTTHSSLVAGDFLVVVDSVAGGTKTALFGEVKTSVDLGTAGGRTIIGDTAASGSLTLKTTSNATLGQFNLSGLSMQLTSSGTTPNAMGSSTGMDLQLERNGATQTISGAGNYNAILAGGRHYAQGAGTYNTLVGGSQNQWNNTSASSDSNIICGGSSNTFSTSTAIDANAIVGGRSCNISSAIGSAIIGGGDVHMDSAATYSLGTGGDNLCSHSYAFICGRGGVTTADMDVCWSNYNIASDDSNANVAWRIDGSTADHHIGRHIDNATAGSNTNILKLHTTEANNQTEFLGLAAPAVLPASGSGVMRYHIATGTIPGGTGAGNVGSLFATPVELIPSPGAGVAVVIDCVYLLLDWDGGAAYDSVVGADDIEIYYGTSGTTICQFETTGFMDQGNDEGRFLRTVMYDDDPVTPGGFDLLAEASNNIYIKVQSSELYAAAGSSPLKYRIQYHVVDLTCGS